MTNQIRIKASVDDDASKKLGGIKGAISQIKAGAKDSILTGVGLGAGIGAFNLAGQAVGAVTDAFKLGISEVIEAESAMAQTEARLKSTGGAANVTASEVADLAGKIQDLAGIDAEDVQAGENLLLTFTKIRNEAGKGNDIFSRATSIMTDMSVALGTDVHSAALQLGKALNDPIKGVTALGRAGVQLTQVQKDQIAAFVKAGDVMSAQKIILQELETQVGGSAEAFGNTTEGKLQKFARGWEDLTSSIVLGAVKVAEAFDENLVQPISDGVDDMALNFGDFGDRLHQIADDTETPFQDVKDRIKELMEVSGLSFTEAAEVAERELSKIPKTAKATMGAVTPEFHSALMAAKGVVETDMEAIAKVPEEAIEAHFDGIRAAAYQSQVEYAKGLLDAQNEPKVAYDALLQMQDEELSRAEEISRLRGELASQGLADGLNDKRDGVRNAAIAAREAIVQRLIEIDAYPYGYNIGSELAAGLDSRYGVVRTSAGRLAQAIEGQIGIRSEPKDPSSPLRGITKFGGNIAKELAKGMTGGMAGVRSAASGLGGGAAGAFGGAGSSGGPVVIQLQLDGRTVAQVVDRQLVYMNGGSGLLPRT